MPHATIATQLSKTESEFVFAALNREIIPFAANAESIAVVKCEPYSETIAEFLLEGEKTL